MSDEHTDTDQEPVEELFPGLSEKELQLLALLLFDDLSQAELARRLEAAGQTGDDPRGVSQATVSRMVSKLVDRFGLQKRWTGEFSEKHEEKLREICDGVLRHREREISLVDKLKELQEPKSRHPGPLRAVHIAPVDGGGKKDTAFKAAEVVAGLMRNQPQVVGVTWGETPQYLAARLAQLTDRKPSNPPIVFPAAGEVIFRGRPRDIGQSASVIAKRLALIWGSDSPPSLAAVPAFLDFAGDMDRTLEGCDKPLDRFEVMSLLRSFYQEGHGYRRVFGSDKNDPDALIHQAEGLICGMGALGDNPTPTLRARLTRRQQRDLSRYIAGDVGGVILSHPSISDSEFDEWIKPLNKACLGIRYRYFRSIALNERMGVVAVANGKLKAKVALTAVKKCCVTHLVIDQDLADELERLLDKNP